MRKFLRYSVVIVNVAVAMALLLSTLCGKFAPSEHLLPSLLSYAYIHLLVANLAFVVIWIFFKRWECMISIVAILLKASYIPLYIQVNGVEKVPEEDGIVTLMTYNVHNFYGSGHDMSLVTLREVDSIGRIFLDCITEEDPDIMCLQEYYNSTQRINLKERLAALGYQYSSGETSGKEPFGTVVFSKFPVIGGQKIGESKYLSKILIGKDTLNVISLHLNSYHLDTTDAGEVARWSHGKMQKNIALRTLGKFRSTIFLHQEEWDEIEPFLEENSGFLVLMGDMNDTPASYIYQKMSQYLNDSYKLCGKGLGTTYHGPFPAFRIDYALCSKNLDVRSYHNTNWDISDHVPVCISIKMPTKE